MDRLNLVKRWCAVFALWAATAIALPAQTFTTLHTFDGKDGSAPVAGLVQATNGDFYGTTLRGGENSLGSVFRITPSGTLTTLYSFCSQLQCSDGSLPWAVLVQGTNGDLYGTTFEGGTSTTGCDGGGCGTVFKITPEGALTTLYGFCAQSGCADGANPTSLVQGSNGDFYGTTTWADGSIFKITPAGAFTTLYSFCPQGTCTDGQHPNAGLVQATNGDFYGTAFSGGTYYDGTIFKITPSGAVTTLYNNFCAQIECPGGYNPSAGLVQATNGDLYGMTFAGGASSNGTFFKITLGGVLTTLYSFADYFYPPSILVQGTDGNFYGTFVGLADGMVFEFTPSGTFTTLYTFCAQSGCADGEYTASTALIQATNGEFYGTTTEGGADGDGCTNGCGTIFSLSVGLGPFVETQTKSGKVGAAVKILGNNLTGSTSVTFNGTAAVFTVVSASEITTTVPAGATTGTVQVVTAGGTLSSNVPFRVP